jgi:hypothetical protein
MTRANKDYMGVTPKNTDDNSNGGNLNWDLSAMRMERIEMEMEERKIEKDRRKDYIPNGSHRERWANVGKEAGRDPQNVGRS